MAIDYWAQLGDTLAEIDALMIKVGRIEVLTYCCAVCAGLLAVYFAVSIIKREIGPALSTAFEKPAEKVVLKQSITSFSSVKPINSNKLNREIKQDPELERMLEEFRR